MSYFSNYTSDYSVLFDLDGTIVDSRSGIVSTLHRVLSDLGHSPDPKLDLAWVVGPPLTELIAQVLLQYHDFRIDEAIALYRHHYDLTGRFSAPVFPGMRALLCELAASEIRLFTATSKPAGLAKQILEMNGLDSCFEAICGAAEDDSGGEKPEMIKRIMKGYGLISQHTLMVGDRRFDISGAHANRIRGIGVLWGYGSEDELISAGADMLVETSEALHAGLHEQFHAADRIQPDETQAAG